VPLRKPGAVACTVSDLFSALPAGPRAGDATAGGLPCGTGSSPGTPAAPGRAGEDAPLQGLSALAAEHRAGLGRPKCRRRRSRCGAVVQDLRGEEMENPRSGETGAGF